MGSGKARGAGVNPSDEPRAGYGNAKTFGHGRQRISVFFDCQAKEAVITQATGLFRSEAREV
jgi:hypothetical protein